MEMKIEYEKYEIIVSYVIGRESDYHVETYYKPYNCPSELLVSVRGNDIEQLFKDMKEFLKSHNTEHTKFDNRMTQMFREIMAETVGGRSI